jgi:hypothetical protein
MSVYDELQVIGREALKIFSANILSEMNDNNMGIQLRDYKSYRPVSNRNNLNLKFPNNVIISHERSIFEIYIHKVIKLDNTYNIKNISLFEISKTLTDLSIDIVAILKSQKDYSFYFIKGCEQHPWPTFSECLDNVSLRITAGTINGENDPQLIFDSQFVIDKSDITTRDEQ